jgi:hypothetical protein
MTIRILLAVAVLIAVACRCGFSGDGDAFTDPAKAGPDVAIQGEYKGEITIDGEQKAVGAQVIARGDGKFDAILFHGGLPGDGWKRGDAKENGNGQRDGGLVTFAGPFGSGQIQNGKFTLMSSGGENIGALNKLERKSPTLGAKPPEGAIVLFDGSGVGEFPGAKMTEDKLLLAGAFSKREFGDFTLHVEFRTPFMPNATGQARGNSGVYLQNRYEIQVLDSFGLNGESNECGGLYSLKAPAVNMCLPPLTWQTYDIDFTAAKFDGDKKTRNARATIRHNGVAIYDDMEIPSLTPGGASTEAPGRGPFQLQWHGNPVTYRNIWVVEK